MGRRKRTPATPQRLGDAYIGLDPGLGGGITYLDGSTITCVPMPVTDHDIGMSISSFVAACRERGQDVRAVIEKQWGRPGDLASRVGKLLDNYGLLRGILVALKVPYDDVAATKWEKLFVATLPNPKGSTRKQRADRKRKHKNNLKAAAQRLFPDLKITLKTCDSVLLAEYGRRTNK